MATSIVPQPPSKPSKAFRAHLHDTEVVLTKVDGRIVIVTPAGDALRYFEVEDATFCTILGEIGLADTQHIIDQMHGGAARICTTRSMEVQ
jgi:hypothetical protein